MAGRLECVSFRSLFVSCLLPQPRQTYQGSSGTLPEHLLIILFCKIVVLKGLRYYGGFHQYSGFASIKCLGVQMLCTFCIGCTES
ncbi:hypothetical protein BGM19_09980 [Streptomyces agglomeratus]|nr:hypothetical protein BGM19_09980 [Streptomyces agglomeratus]